MSGLWRRLTGQAMANAASRRSSVRPASSVHAQMPLGAAHDVEESLPAMIEPPTATTRDPLGSENRPARRIAAVEAADDPNTSSREPHMLPPAHAVPTGATIDRHHFAREITRTVERVREIPAPLLAQAPLPRVVPFTGTPMPPPRNPAREPEHREEPTEVHVHIGRIEVTAAPEPAAPKKTRPAPRETRPLADYLARKGRA